MLNLLDKSGTIVFSLNKNVTKTTTNVQIPAPNSNNNNNKIVYAPAPKLPTVPLQSGKYLFLLL